MIFPSRSQLASKQITRTGRAEAVTKEGLAATLLPGRQPDQMGQRHSLRPVRPRSCPGALRNGSFCCISTRMWSLPLIEIVSIRAPRTGGDAEQVALADRVASFNPRPRTGGDRRRQDQTGGSKSFQSAPPHGGRQTRPHRPLHNSKFQSAPPPRGATETGLKYGAKRLFQSAPPHGGRLAALRILSATQAVSIRAPARGATLAAG